MLGRHLLHPHNTRDGRGIWVITPARDQRSVLQDTDTFSSHRSIFASALGENWPMIPLELDPPAHGIFRSLLNPLFSPERVRALEPAIRVRAIALIDRIAASGTSCDVMKDFAFPFAVSIFLRFLGLSDDRLDLFVGWGKDLLHGEGVKRPAAAQRIVSFIDDLAALRRKVPVGDFMTFVVEAKVEGRPLTDKEVLGIGVLVFVAGLDTVAAAIGFDLAYLARNPKDQEWLRPKPERIVLAAEELLRAFPTVQMIRVATKDIDFEGAPIRKGDYISCATMTAKRDPTEFAFPDTVDLAREDNCHTAFAHGPPAALAHTLRGARLSLALRSGWRASPRSGSRKVRRPSPTAAMCSGSKI